MDAGKQVIMRYSFKKVSQIVVYNIDISHWMFSLWVKRVRKLSVQTELSLLSCR